jgi:hypothetical protein
MIFCYLIVFSDFYFQINFFFDLQWFHKFLKFYPHSTNAFMVEMMSFLFIQFTFLYLSFHFFVEYFFNIKKSKLTGEVIQLYCFIFSILWYFIGFWVCFNKYRFYKRKFTSKQLNLFKKCLRFFWKIIKNFIVKIINIKIFWNDWTILKLIIFLFRCY